MNDLPPHRHPVASSLASSSVRPAWCREPKIDETRQRFLRQHLAVVPNVQQGIYPFKGIQLTRADVEWLLLTHEHGRGPIEWSDSPQQKREGIDLRGADLQYVDLRSLPLARMRGGLTKEEWVATTLEQRMQAGVHLEHADLSEAHLEGALLRGAFLQSATLRATHLEQAILFHAYLEQTYLRAAHLEGANMMYAHLEGTYLRKAWLNGADLRHAVCDNATNIEKVSLSDKKWGCVRLADVHWDDCNLAVIDWQHVMPLGDEALARAGSMQIGHTTTPAEKRYAHDAAQAAVRAYRQLANAMRAQGMNEEAVPFAYRALVLQRTVLWQQVLWGQKAVTSAHPRREGKGRRVLGSLWHRIRSLDSLIFSYFLDMLAGYGHKPGRSLLIYLLTIALFALCYLLLGHLPPREAFIFSITSFHGRGFFPGPFTLGDNVTALAALEAVVGLFIEISFIATFTQRFFGR